jgi:pyruvate dehydrogenase E1 component alpha subunit
LSVGATLGAAEPLRLLAPDGTLAAGHVPALQGEALLDAWRAMLRSQVIDARCFSLQRQGRLGVFSPVDGEEAAIVGSAWALDPARDWVVPQYRELPAMLRQGYRLEQALRYYGMTPGDPPPAAVTSLAPASSTGRRRHPHGGEPAGARVDPDVRVLPFQISLAAQIPHAVGLAWGLRHQGVDGVVCVYFGEGASSEGDAHEALNLAGVRRAPVVFVLRNNGWAISTPVRKQTAAASLAARAAGYGIAGELVDGNDLFAMHDACSRAVARARAGEGPTLVEARTYRLGPHNTSDDPSRYVDGAELEAHRAVEPVARMRAYLEAEGLSSPDAERRLRAELEAEVDAAIASVEATPPDPAARVGALFDHVYARPPARVEQQRAQARAGEEPVAREPGR